MAVEDPKLKLIPEAIQGVPKRTLKGNELGLLPLADKLTFAGQVSAVLKAHTDTMLQYEPEELVTFMDAGLAVVALNEQNPHVLAAFGRLHQWEGLNDQGQVVYEFRTWVSAVKGNGTNVLRGAIELGREIDPNSQIISIVEDSNQRANIVFQRFGGILIPRPSNVPVVLQDGQAQVHCYDLSHIDTTSGPNK